jgi:hypothetical protein
LNVGVIVEITVEFEDGWRETGRYGALSSIPVRISAVLASD